MSARLKPCPACPENRQTVRNLEDWAFDVKCERKCDGCIGQTPGTYRTRTGAVRVWNKRVDLMLKTREERSKR